MKKSRIGTKEWLDWNVGKGKKFKDLEELLKELEAIRDRFPAPAAFGSIGYAGGEIEDEIVTVKALISKRDAKKSQHGTNKKTEKRLGDKIREIIEDCTEYECDHESWVDFKKAIPRILKLIEKDIKKVRRKRTMNKSGKVEYMVLWKDIVKIIKEE